MGPLLVGLIYLVVNDIRAYLKTLKYKSQGFAQKYVPIIGQIKLFIPHKEHPRDGLYNLKTGMTQADGKPGLVFNYAFGGSAMVYLTEPSLIREFLLKENSVTRRYEFIKVSNNFFFDNSQQALDHRMVFSEMFRIDNIQKLIAYISADICKHLADVKERSDINESGSLLFTTDWQKPHGELLSGLANSILFGSSINAPRIDDPEQNFVVDALLHLIRGPAIEAIVNPLNILFRGLPFKYNLLPSARLANKLTNQIKDAIKKEYTQRVSDQGYVPRTNILDLMLAHNKSEQAAVSNFHKFSLDDIVADMTLFLLAGTDTTTKTLSGCLYYLAKYPAVETKLYREMCAHNLQRDQTTEITIELLNSLVYMEAFLKECLRHLAIAPSTFDKLILEDFTLGNIKFFKGDKLVLPFVYHFSSAKYFDNPEAFDPERFVDGRTNGLQPMAFIPFSSGRRMCLGRNLAETIVKVYLIETLRRFEVSLPETHTENSWTFGKGGLNQQHCTATFSVRPADSATTN